MLNSFPPGKYYFPSQAGEDSSAAREYFPTRKAPGLNVITAETPDDAVHQKWKKESADVVKGAIASKNRRNLQLLTNPLPPSGREDRSATQQRRPDWDLTYTQNGSLVGGVATKFGADYIKRRLAARVDEYNAINTQSAQQVGQKSALKTEDETPTSTIFALLNQVNDQLVTGVVDSKLLDMLNTLVARVLSQGASLQVSDITRILDSAYTFENDIYVLQAVRRSDPAKDRNAILNSAGRIIRRLIGILGTLNQSAFASPEEKKLILKALQPEFSKTIVETGEPTNRAPAPGEKTVGALNVVNPGAVPGASPPPEAPVAVQGQGKTRRPFFF